VNTVEHRVLAAMSAASRVIDSAPPLELREPSADRARPGRPALRWHRWAIPLVAAVAVIALAGSLVLVRGMRNGPAVPAATSGRSPAPGGVPPYYVALVAQPGWYAYAPLSGQSYPAPPTELVVGTTASGQRLATVARPAGLTFNVVTGAADDRTFVVGALPYSPSSESTAAPAESWYLLRLTPGSTPVARLTRLPIPDGYDVTGAAVSPDGTALAVASRNSGLGEKQLATGSPLLTVYSLATGAVLRHWDTRTGQITAANQGSAAYGLTGIATTLRWTPDGRDIAFGWNGSEIRLISATAAGADLVKASTLRAWLGQGYTLEGPAFTCDATDGWSVSAGARIMTCAASVGSLDFGAHPNADCGRQAPLHLEFLLQINLSGGAAETNSFAQVSTCDDTELADEGASLGWASPDGLTVIGSLNYPGHSQFGVFAFRDTFIKLPTLPGQLPLTLVAW